MDHCPLYLDAQSTTPIDPRVLEVMAPWLSERFANAASRTHAPGREAHRAVERAREQIAAMIHADAAELIFTSGATESNNLAIKGVVHALRSRGNHVVTLATEHKSVLDPLTRLERERQEHLASLKALVGNTESEHLYRRGAEVTVLGVDREGLVSAERFLAALRRDTILASAMFANNEIGVLQPVAALASLCRERDIVFHCDAAQGMSTSALDVRAVDADLVSLSAHKLHGPKGIGALYLRRRASPLRLRPLIDGGGQERGLRSGTLNVAAIVGFGAAAELAQKERREEHARLLALRDRLLARLRATVARTVVHGALEARVPGNLSVAFPLVDAGVLLERLPELALSTGSACTSASLEPSHVLRALGVPNDLARSTVRIGLSRFSSEKDVDFASARLSEEVAHLRSMNPAWALLDG